MCIKRERTPPVFFLNLCSWNWEFARSLWSFFVCPLWTVFFWFDPRLPLLCFACTTDPNISGIMETEINKQKEKFSGFDIKVCLSVCHLCLHLILISVVRINPACFLLSPSLRLIILFCYPLTTINLPINSFHWCSNIFSISCNRMSCPPHRLYTEKSIVYWFIFSCKSTMD